MPEALSASTRRADVDGAVAKAAALLAQFGFQAPPVDPVQIARELGFAVHFVQFKDRSSTISGFYDAEERAIYVNRDEYPLRQTFTIAHELGHALLHQEWAASEEYKILRRDQEPNGDPMEQEANVFAAHLLVPRFMLDQYKDRLDPPKLSKLFTVSIPVINNRIKREYP